MGSILKFSEPIEEENIYQRNFCIFAERMAYTSSFATRYTPQKNGVAERKNQTIMEMVRSMLKEKHFPNEYWEEKTNCAVYILNRCPIKPVMNKVPKEA